MFKIGQKVVCTNDLGWIVIETGQPTTGPEKGEILEIDFFDDAGYLGFNKYGGEGYYPPSFRPLHDNIVKNIIKQVTEKPIVIP